MTPDPPTAGGPLPRAAVQQALETFERPLVDYARRLLGGDVERARDVVQETFLRLCQRPPDAARVREWLYTVCRNLAVDVRRKESRRMEWIDDRIGERGGAVHGAAATLEERDAREALNAVLEELPAREREALRLRFQHGLAYREVAEVMGESVGNVSWWIHAGVQRLRAKLSRGVEL